MDVALVVGASSNLGYQVLVKLITVYKGKIYFTTDDDDAGYHVLDRLSKTGANLHYIHMDITYPKSIVRLRHKIQDQDDRIELIINCTDYVSKKRIPHDQKVRKTLSVNFYGFINFGKLVYPLLTTKGRVVNVSGPAGLLATIPNENIKKRISDAYITEDELVAIMQEYEDLAVRGMEKMEGWGLSVQAVSKVALNAVTFLQHREWADQGVIINCVNPGNVTSRENRKSSNVFEEGAKAILYLAMEAPLSIKGNFVWSNFSVIEWGSDPYVEVTPV